MCTECGKRFHQPSHLRAHMRAHSGTSRPSPPSACPGRGDLRAGLAFHSPQQVEAPSPAGRAWVTRPLTTHWTLQGPTSEVGFLRTHVPCGVRTRSPWASILPSPGSGPLTHECAAPAEPAHEAPLPPRALRGPTPSAWALLGRLEVDAGPRLSIKLCLRPCRAEGGGRDPHGAHGEAGGFYLGSVKGRGKRPAAGRRARW